MVSEPPAEKGRVLGGRYRVVRELGRGGFGAVFEAVDEHLQRSVAIKLMHSASVTAPAELAREAALLASVRSPHVVLVLDVAVEEEPPYLVMELLDGASLRQQLTSGGAMDLAGAVRVLGAVLKGLRALHDRALLHGDLKPENVVLTSRGVKLIDLGISRPWMDPSWSADNGIPGTPSYLAPEVVRGERPDPRADLYAAGLLFYEILAGQPAHAQRPEWKELAREIVEGRRTPLSLVSPWVELSVSAFVRMALDPDPEERFQNAGEMLEALAFLERASRSTIPDGSVASGPAAEPPSIRGALAGPRARALANEPGVRDRFFHRGGRPGFFDLLDRPWVSLRRYCRFLDSAYGRLGEAQLVRFNREEVRRESEEGGPFHAIISSAGDPSDLTVIVPQMWTTAFRNAGHARMSRTPTGLELTIEGARSELRTSPGWRAMLSGSLLGILDALGMSATVRLRDEDGSVSWLLSPAPSSRVEGIDAPGRLLGQRPKDMLGERFVLQRRLGAGGFGRVWGAHDLQRDQLVAIKLLALRGSMQAPARVAKLAGLRSAHVARIYDLVELDEDRSVLVMEHLSGRALTELIGRPLPLASVRTTCAQLLAGLAEAHRSGLVHGDIKPSNVLIGHSGPDLVVKLLGFRLGDEGSARRGLTPGYVAPELLETEGEPTARSDVYSAAALFRELFLGSGRSRVSPESIPAAMRPMLERALSASPAERYADAGAFLAACRQARARVA